MYRIIQCSRQAGRQAGRQTDRQAAGCLVRVTCLEIRKHQFQDLSDQLVTIAVGVFKKILALPASWTQDGVACLGMLTWAWFPHSSWHEETHIILAWKRNTGFPHSFWHEETHIHDSATHFGMGRYIQSWHEETRIIYYSGTHPGMKRHAYDSVTYPGMKRHISNSSTHSAMKRHTNNTQAGSGGRDIDSLD